MPWEHRNKVNNMNLRAVVFDYGMVLSAAADPSARWSLMRICGLDEDTFELHYWANRRAYDAGELVGETYWQQIASGAGIILGAEQIQTLIDYDIKMWSSVDHAMVAWALRVRECGYLIGILSNISKELVSSLEQQFPWIHQFDHTVWSCRVGLAKPDTAIFRHTLKQFRMLPEDILYIDDREENIKSAGRLGIGGIIYKNMPQLRSQLQLLDISELLPPI